MRVDDDGLLQSLHEGMFETPLWREFLNRLLAKTGAQVISLVFRPVHADEDVRLFAGAGPSADIISGFAKDHPIAFRTMRPVGSPNSACISSHDVTNLRISIPQNYQQASIRRATSCRSLQMQTQSPSPLLQLTDRS